MHRPSCQLLAGFVQFSETGERFARPLRRTPDKKRFEQSQRGRVHAQHVGAPSRYRKDQVDAVAKLGSKRIGQQK